MMLLDNEPLLKVFPVESSPRNLLRRQNSNNDQDQKNEIDV